MGVLDDDRSQAPSVPDEDATTAAENADLVDPREEQQDIWAQSEGYTPLADIQYSSLMVALGPSDGEDDDGDDDHENNNETNGTFFVDASTFSATDDGDGEKNDDDLNENMDNVARSSEFPTSTVSDFESIANKALSLLDEEYQRTFHGERRPPSWKQDTASTTAIRASDMPDEELASSFSTQDADLKVIAAAFDERAQLAIQNGFVADWDCLPLPTTPKSASLNQDATALVSIDTDVVRKVVQTLSENRDNPFQKKFAEWQERQQSLPPTHDLIPATPYAAFRRTTTKAKQATASLSRSATMAEALQRLRNASLLPMDVPTLLVDVIGVDHTECESIARVQSTFRPIVRWIGTWRGCQFQHVHFRLIGRDLTNDHSITGMSSIDLLTPKTATILQSAFATCHSGVYHTLLSESSQVNECSITSPHLAIAYNAGIWGYKEWETTIQYLCERRDAPAIPFVVTAYTLEECQEDFEVIETVANVKLSGSGGQILWNAETNPFGSKIIRETKSRSNEYRENAAWQAWLLGGTCTRPEQL